MIRRLTLLFAGLMLLAGTTAPALPIAGAEAPTRMAGASGVWLPPTALGTTPSHAPTIALNARGDAVAVWRDRNTAEITARVRAATSGRWAAPRALGPDSSLYIPPAVGVDALGNADAVWVADGSQGKRYVHSSHFSVTAGRWSTPIAISGPNVGYGHVALGVDAAGNATAAWVFGDDRGGGYELRSAHRRAGQGWTPFVSVARTPSETFFQGFDLAVSSDGSTLLVWSLYAGYWAEPVGTKPYPITVRAALGRHGTWETATTIATGQESDGQPSAAAGAGGLAAVGWRGSEHGNAMARVSVRPAGATGWGPETRISFEDGQAGAPKLGIDGRGNITAVWSTNVDIETASLTAGSSAWARPTAISGPTGWFITPTLAVSENGDAVVLWNTSTGNVVGTRRPAGAASWDSPIVVSGDARTQLAWDGVAVDAAGDAVVAWTEIRSDGWYGGVGSATFDAAAPRLASVRVPRKGRVGNRLTFAALTRDISATSIRWRFGDGRYGIGSTLQHMYRRTGRYSVTVRATDAAGHMASSTHVIWIAR